ncbi:MAG: glycosyltransferase family 1 protein [Rhodospirillales bacterium]|nr:glycosyltransferase family 1 protein [Rhodospirillales bacterium]MCB9994999.1 glycosyltransferase family 1 protein [Rhodospirillales bacterium]
MKILIISDAWRPQINGVVRTYEHIGAELEHMGHEIKVIGPADFPFRMKLPGYAEIELALNPYGRLKKMIDAWDPGAIHIATEGPLGQAGRRYCAKNGFKFTTSYHTHFPDYAAKRAGKFLPFLTKPVKEFFIRQLRDFHHSGAGLLIATQSLEEELRGWGFETPMHRLTRGVHLDIFKPGEPELFDHLPRPIALFVGRVAIEKNLEAFLDMRWHGSKVIVGDGPDLAMLRAKYPDAHFAGSKVGDDLGAHYRSADIFVFPSKTDTFGMVLIEALAAGLPVAAYNVTGPRDIITEPFLGALHDDDLANAAGRALEQAAHKDKRHHHVKEHYTWPAVARQFLEVIEQVGK